MRMLVSHIKESISLWKIVLLIFGFQFFLASTVGLQMQQVLDASIGNSLSIEKLQTGFSHTVFQDFLNEHGGSFSTLYGQMRWMVLIYLVFAAFISAGTIYVLVDKDYQISRFFHGGVKYFTRFILLDLIFSSVILLLVGAGIAMIGYLFGIAPYEFDDELTFLRWTMLIAIILIILIMVFTLWKIKAKFSMISGETKLWASIKIGIKEVWASKWSLLLISFFFLLVSLLFSIATYAAGDLPLLPMILVINAILVLKIFWRIVFFKVVGD